MKEDENKFGYYEYETLDDIYGGNIDKNSKDYLNAQMICQFLDNWNIEYKFMTDPHIVIVTTEIEIDIASEMDMYSISKLINRICDKHGEYYNIKSHKLNTFLYGGYTITAQRRSDKQFIADIEIIGKEKINAKIVAYSRDEVLVKMQKKLNDEDDYQYRKIDGYKEYVRNGRKRKTTKEK